MHWGRRSLYVLAPGELGPLDAGFFLAAVCWAICWSGALMPAAMRYKEPATAAPSGETSTETLSWCAPPPTMKPLIGLTSP